MRESEEQWLHEVAPTMQALALYLTRENNGVRVYEQRTTVEAKTGRELHHMSNGMAYSKDKEGRWEIVW